MALQPTPFGAQDEEVAVASNSKSVFVVHGRNEALRKATFDFLRSIGLSPLEWTQAVKLTGDGSPYIGQVLDAAFDHAQAIVVLLTPDEVAYLEPRYADRPDDPETQPAGQARPNVLFEAGMALGRNATRTVLVEIGESRPFSDVAGRHTVRLNGNIASRQELANRLGTAGCDVDLTGTDWHSTGDFTPPTPAGGGLPLGRRIPSISHARPPVDFAVKYVNKGGSRIDKLQMINRGTETAYDVKLAVPDNAALDLFRAETIPKIPGEGKSVTVDVYNHNRTLGGPSRISAFDVTVTARTEGGETITQDVFLDMNG